MSVVNVSVVIVTMLSTSALRCSVVNVIAVVVVNAAVAVTAYYLPVGNVINHCCHGDLVFISCTICLFSIVSTVTHFL